MNKSHDVCIIGAGHNGLVSSIILARAGLSVKVHEGKKVVGGAAKTENPFKLAPNLGHSTGAYLLGVMPPELISELGLKINLVRRDPHYFLPTLNDKYLLLGADSKANDCLPPTFSFPALQLVLCYRRLRSDDGAGGGLLASTGFWGPRARRAAGPYYGRRTIFCK